MNLPQQDLGNMSESHSTKNKPQAICKELRSCSKLLQEKNAKELQKEADSECKEGDINAICSLRERQGVQGAYPSSPSNTRQFKLASSRQPQTLHSQTMEFRWAHGLGFQTASAYVLIQNCKLWQKN